MSWTAIRRRRCSGCCDYLHLTGAKFGCGACTAHVEEEAVRSCSLPLEAVAGRVVTTIEGMSPDRGSRPARLG